MRINDHKKKTAFIEFASEESWATYSIFNANSFSPALRNIVSACSTRAAMFLFQVRVVNRKVTADKDTFIKQLERQFNKSWAEGFIGAKVNRDFDFIVIHNGLGYLSAFHALLYSLKSLLDIYANLMVKTILPSASLQFKKSKVTGQEISGGKIINWLKYSAPSTFPKAPALADVILQHSVRWITQAVDYRDILSHYGDIKGMEHMHVLLKREYPPFKPNGIMLPAMPDGQPVKDYCVALVDKLRAFFEDSLKLLPNVDLSLINFDGFKLPPL